MAAAVAFLLAAVLAACTSATVPGSPRVPPSEPRAPTTATSTPPAAPRALCAPVFVGVPGSGQGLDNPAPTSAPAGVSLREAHAYGSTVALARNALVRRAGRGLASARALDYPAVPASEFLGPFGLTTRLDESERRGARDLVMLIRGSYRHGCAARPVLLVGYSQGAEVVSRAVRRLTPVQQSHVTAVLYGDPSFTPGRPGDVPAHQRVPGLRPALQNGRAFTLPARAAVLDLCAVGDPICGPHFRGGLVTSTERIVAHLHVHDTAYGNASTATQAADFLWTHRAR